MQNDLISVIMSTYNERLDWIEKSVESILDQTYKNIEFVIVVDNPEHVPLVEMLSRYGSEDDRIRLIINETNQGLVKSLNLALESCNGKFIARMDADDISSPERLELQKNYLEENKLDFVFSGVEVIDEENIVQYESNSTESDAKETQSRLEKINMSYHSTWFLKREIYTQLEGYREIKYCEDYDFLLRSLNQGFKIGKMSGELVQYRIRQDSISRSYSLEQFLNAKGILKLYKNNLLEDEFKVESVQAESNKLANEKERNRYNKADNLYFNGVKLVRNGKRVRGLFSLVKSVSSSKYYFIRNVDILKYKLLNRN